MSYPGPYRPPLSGWGPPPPPEQHHPPYYFPHQGPYPPPPPPDGGAVTAPPPYQYYFPGTMMIPVPVAPMPVPAPPTEQFGQNNNTYITNHIYQNQPDSVLVAESSGDLDWVPTTSTLANTLTGRAVSGGHEGWDGSPLWIIRGWHNGDLIPGKLSVRHNAASIAYNGKEVPVQNIEVLCAKPETLRWVPASNGNVPPSAIPGGRTASGETLFIGRARYQLSVTPGKIHPSLNSCFIAFAGSEVTHKMYDVLCTVS